jgi:hypothetical protein
LLSFTFKSNSSNSKDGLTYSAVNLPPGAAFDSATGAFNWTPATAGIYPVQFTIKDGPNHLSSIIIIKVDNGSDPPAITAVTTYLAERGKPLAFTVTAVDPDGEPLTYFAGNLPPGATFNPTTKTFTWTPGPGQIGEHTARFTVSDGILSDSRDIKIIVDNINQPPVFDAVSARNVTSGSLLQFSVNAVDTDGDPLTYTAANLPDGAGFNPTDKTFSWTPDDSQTGSYQIKFTASDGILTTSMDVAITVTNPVVYGGKITVNTNPNIGNNGGNDPADSRNFNRQPVFNLINPQNVNEEKLLQFTINAVDPDGNSLTYTASNLPEGASFDSTSKTFTWTPELEQAGSYRVNFTVSDGELTDSQEVLIDVNMVDVGVGLNYFGARFYDPEVGRFLTKDLYTNLPNDERLIYIQTLITQNDDKYIEETILDKGLSIPQSQNYYVYCANNPIGNIDPDGRAYEATKAIVSTGWGACLADGPFPCGDALYAVAVISTAITETWALYGDKLTNMLQAAMKGADAAKDGKGSKFKSGNSNKSNNKNNDNKVSKNTTKNFNRAVKELGLDKNKASKALHDAKRAAGRGGKDNVEFDLNTGDIISPETGESIGSLFD